MNVRVLLFGPLTGLAGPGPHALTLSPGATVQQLLDVLFEKWPTLSQWDPSLLIAINLAYAQRTDLIPAGAEIALMPPVQGG